MKILSITAQKPHSTGSGVYLTELVNAFDRLGHSQAVIAGKRTLSTFRTGYHSSRFIIRAPLSPSLSPGCLMRCLMRAPATGI